jgi:hypothetical protein
MAKLPKRTEKDKIAPNTLHIVITDRAGDTLVGLKMTLEPSNDLDMILREPYLITRLIDDSKTVKDLKAEFHGRSQPRFIWSGK